MNKTRGLWRGKRINNKEHNGEWVEGFFYPVRYTGYSIPGSIDYYIVTCPSGGGRLQIQVDPSTLGECTGSIDKNGKLIFEGDILRHNSGTLHEVVFEQRNGKAYFGWVIGKNETWQFDWDFLRQLEVIGNIHDNPELLKGERDETD